MPAKKLIKNKKYLAIIGLLFVVLIFFGVIFILTKSKKPKEKSIPRTDTTVPEQVEEEIDKEKFYGEAGSEMLAYIEKLEVITEKAAKGMAKRGEIVAGWPNWTENDIDEFTTAGDMIEDAYQEIRVLTPPKAYTSVHQKFLNGLKFWSEAVPVGDKGFVSQDNDLIQESLSLTAEGNQWLDRAKKELREISSP